MNRTPLRLLTALVLVAAGLRWIVNSNPWSGPVVLRVSAAHGVHSNDWLSFVLWALALLMVSPAGAVRMRMRRAASA